MGKGGEGTHDQKGFGQGKSTRVRDIVHKM